MLHRTRTPSILIALALFAAACSDAPTGPTVVPEAAFSSQGANSSAAGSGASPYACFTSVATPGGQYKYRYGRLELRFPGEVLAPEGTQPLRYRYRLIGKDGNLQRVANCVIPRTRGAVRMMNRRFGAEENAGLPEGGSTDGGMTAMGDVYELEPIIVDGGSRCSDSSWTRDEDGVCRSSRGGGGSPGGGWDGGGGDWGGGGGGNDPCTGCEPDDTPTGEPVANDEEPVCRIYPEQCDQRDPAQAEKDKALAEVNKIRTDGFCGEVRTLAEQMINRGLKVWENTITATDDNGKPGTLIGFADWVYSGSNPGPIMSLWTGGKTPEKGGINVWTIAHEAIHGMPKPGAYHNYGHKDITPLGMTLDDTAKYCAQR